MRWGAAYSPQSVLYRIAISSRGCGTEVFGRYKLTVSFREIVRLYNLTNSVNLPSRYNIAPTQDVLVVIDDGATKQRRGEMMRWGLVPFWAKDAKIGYSLINAKAETVAEKPAFRDAFKKRRCIIPADGFYEGVRRLRRITAENSTRW